VAGRPTDLTYAQIASLHQIKFLPIYAQQEFQSHLHSYVIL
jgi:hypothetical protein